MQEHCDELKINYSQSADAGTLWQAKNEQFPIQVMQEHCDELKINYSQSGDARTLWRKEQLWSTCYKQFVWGSMWED